MGLEMEHRTLGILGFGNIGKRVARYGQAFRMKVLAYDPFVTPEQGAPLPLSLYPTSGYESRPQSLKAPPPPSLFFTHPVPATCALRASIGIIASVQPPSFHCRAVLNIVIPPSVLTCASCRPSTHIPTHHDPCRP